MGALSGKVAIVTGATSGLGRAAALLFAQEGASVVAGGRRETELQSLVAEIGTTGGAAEAVPGDVRQEDVAAALVERAMARFGRLDIGFNNAGVFAGVGPTTGVALADWTEALDVNLTGAFLGAKHQIPRILDAGGGSVIFTGGYLGTSFGFPATAAYATSKAALVGLTQSLAVEFGPQRVRVNVLIPGAIDSPSFRAVHPTPERVAFFAGMHALKRVASPEEIAQTALYLASDASGFTTGSVLFADGGLSVNRT